jgi:hypothetical protein
MTRRIGLAIASAAVLVAGGPGCNEGDTLVAPTLTAECAANPATGAAPLTVAFSLNVSGAQGAFTVAVSYGDGASGTNPDQPHTYAAPGTYTAAFTVKTTLQSASCSTTVTASTLPPVNQPPQPVFQTTPRTDDATIRGTAPLTVKFSMCLTSDPEGDPLLFTMDFLGDGRVDIQGTTGAFCRRSYTYPAGDVYPEVCVTDLGPDARPRHPFQCQTYRVTATP